MPRNLSPASAARKIVDAVAEGKYPNVAAAVEANPTWQPGLAVLSKAASGTTEGLSAPEPKGSGGARLSR